ncbi:MAG: site-2 protease family protein [Cyanobacteria bacterium J06598_1]
MTQLSPSAEPVDKPAAKPSLTQKFGVQWLLGNVLAHGVGMSLPLLWAELWSPQLLTTQEYAGYITTAFATFGFWAGLAQWLLLRQVFPISARWILVVGVAPLASAILPVLLMSIAPPAAFLVFITYPMMLSIGQWSLWRKFLRPSWEWVATGCIAIALSLITGLLVGILSEIVFLPPISISVLIGSLSYGLVYGLVTYVGLRRLTQKTYTAPDSQNHSGLEVPPNTQSWKVTLLPGLMLVAVWGVWIVWVLPPPSEVAVQQFASLPLWLQFTCTFGGLYGYSYLSILLHEVGHLLLALANGFDLRAFAVDRWVLVRQGKGWQIFKTNKRYAGGFVLPIPKSLNNLNKRSLMAMIWGGPIASFLLFALSAAPLFLFPSAASNHFWLWALAFLSGVNLYNAIFNTLPLALGYLRTDGRRLLDLAQNNLQGQRFSALYGVNASLRQGLRPREINPTLIEQALAIPEKSSDHVAGLILAYAVALDQGELEQAGHYLDEALALHLYFPEIFRGALLLEGAYFEAHVRQQATVARQWFDQIKERALIGPASLLRAEAALRLAEGDRDAAMNLAEKGLEKVARDRFMKGDAVAEEERLQEIIQTIKERT